MERHQCGATVRMFLTGLCVLLVGIIKPTLAIALVPSGEGHPCLCALGWPNNLLLFRSMHASSCSSSKFLSLFCCRNHRSIKRIQLQVCLRSAKGRGMPPACGPHPAAFASACMRIRH
jgi:hypothetical protein